MTLFSANHCVAAIRAGIINPFKLFFKATPTEIYTFTTRHYILLPIRSPCLYEIIKFPHKIGQKKQNKAEVVMLILDSKFISIFLLHAKFLLFIYSSKK